MGGLEQTLFFSLNTNLYSYFFTKITKNDFWCPPLQKSEGAYDPHPVNFYWCTRLIVSILALKGSALFFIITFSNLKYADTPSFVLSRTVAPLRLTYDPMLMSSSMKVAS